MIEATLFRTGNIYSVDVTGHADYAPAGSDIICAAVSALVQSFTFYCRKTDGIKVLDDEVSEGMASMVIYGDQSKINPAYEMLKTGLWEISLNFPKNILVRGEK